MGTALINIICYSATENNDIDFIDTIICYDFKIFWKLIAWAARTNNLSLFIILYTFSKNIFVIDDHFIVIENNTYYLCSRKGFRFIDNTIIKPITSTISNINKNIDPIISNKILKDWSCINDSREIINYLIDNGLTDYDEWLVFAITHNNKNLIDYFISKGAININTDQFSNELFVKFDSIKSETSDYIKNKFIIYKGISEKYNPYDILVNKEFSHDIEKHVNSIILLHTKQYLIETIKLKNTKLLAGVLSQLNFKYNIKLKFPNLYNSISELKLEKIDIQPIIETLEQCS